MTDENGKDDPQDSSHLSFTDEEDDGSIADDMFKEARRRAREESDEEFVDDEDDDEFQEGAFDEDYGGDDPDFDDADEDERVEFEAGEVLDDEVGDDDEQEERETVLAAPVRRMEPAPKRQARRRRGSKKRRSDGVGRDGHRGDDGGGLHMGVMRLIGIAFAAGALMVIAGAGYAGWYLNKLNKDLPDYQVLAEYAPPVTTRVYAGDGSLVAEFARERRLFVPIESIPDHVKQAFVSAEDKTYYEHSGLDFRGIVRAQISNIGNLLAGRRLEGGSSITQQVAKNFLLSSEQRIERKLREMLIARKMEYTFTKDHILELYLNEIYLGNRSYGVAAAALNYFDKSLDELTIAEAAYLAAITKGPSNYHPVLNKDRAIERRNWVIGRLADDGFITSAEAAEARNQPLGAQIAPPLGARDWTMEYFAEEVRKQIVDLYGVEALYDGGLAVRTSVDPNLQKIAGEALRHWLVEYDVRHGWRGPLGVFEPAEETAIESGGDETGSTNVDDEDDQRPDWARAFGAALDEMRDDRTVSDDMAPWRPVLVRAVSGVQARIGFEDGSEGVIPLEQVKWAREYVSVNDMGDEIAEVSDVLSVNDIVYVDQAREIEEDALIAKRDAPIIEGAYALRQTPAVNGGLIAIDPHTGRVLAMVGGFSFQKSEFNRAVQAERQPGSTFKPFVYAVALDSGYTPVTKVLDAPFVAPGVDSWYKPGNYIEGRYYGNSTLRLGVEQSRNAMTARLAQDLGIGRIMDYIERFELSDRLPRELAISLGAGETTLMRITAAYSIFVNGGKRVEPVLIDRIQDRTGKTIFKRDKRRCVRCNAAFWSEQAEPQLNDLRPQVMDPRTAYQVTSILEGVVVRGTGSAVRRATSKPLAGKTGTTNDYKDAWFVGFAPDLAAGVYVGFDMPQSLGQGEAGGKVAAPIFAEFMVEALKDEAGIPFRVPSGIRLVRVNAKTGEPAGPGDRNVILEAFKTSDIIGGEPSGDDLYLDQAIAGPRRAEEPPLEDDLNGLY